jgi:hypothetical protein
MKNEDGTFHRRLICERGGGIVSEDAGEGPVAHRGGGPWEDGSADAQENAKWCMFDEDKRTRRVTWTDLRDDLIIEGLDAAEHLAVVRVALAQLAVVVQTLTTGRTGVRHALTVTCGT